MSGKCLEIDRGICSKLANCLYQQKKQRLFCDIKVNIGNTACIYLHSCVLAAFSPCLDSLINLFPAPEVPGEENGKWSFKRPLEITLTPENQDSSKLECEKCAIEFFDFLYIGKIKIKEDHVLHVEYLSSLLQIKDLLDACKTYRMEIDPPGTLIYNEIVEINGPDPKNTHCISLDAEKHMVKEMFADKQSTYFCNKMRTLITYKNKKLSGQKKKIPISNQEMSVCSQKTEKERSYENMFGKFVISETALNNETDFSLIQCNILKKMKRVEKQKFTANASTQSVSFPTQRDYKSIYGENIVSSIGYQACNLKEKDTIIHENCPEKLLHNESELVYELNETNTQSKTKDENNQYKKQEIPVIDLTLHNIPELKERTLNTSEKNMSIIHDERETTRCKENDVTFPSEKESVILGTKIINNNKKEILQLSVCDAETSDSSCTNTVKTGHHCVCCDYFAKCHYDLLKHMLLSNHTEKTCSLCLFEADSWKTLSDHILQHNDPQPFICNVCNERFRTLSAVNEHTSKHTGMVPCSCPVCFDLFKSKRDLQKHITLHKEGEMYVCSE